MLPFSRRTRRTPDPADDPAADLVAVGMLPRVATIGMAVVLVTGSTLAVVSALSSVRSASEAVRVSEISDLFAQAQRAVAAEESLERKYRIDPSSDIRDEFGEAAAQLTDAMEGIGDDGHTDDLATASLVLSLHGPYLTSMEALFDAVDRGDEAAVRRLDEGTTEPIFDQIEELVEESAAAHHVLAVDAVHELHSMEQFSARATPVVLAIGLGLVLLFWSVLRRVREVVDRQTRQTRHAARHDGLTGLPNRHLLDQRTGEALRAARRDDVLTGLLLVDLDRFREINDSLGHRYGDALLAQVGARMREVVREVDTVARLGGDEFAVLLPALPEEESALRVAERIRAAMRTEFCVDGVSLDVEASIGVAVTNDPDVDASILLQRADVAMYVAKSQGIGFFVYDPETDGHSPERLAMLSDLRRGLERGELFLYFQPKVSLPDQRVVGAEALLRWVHPQRGMVPPDRFIPLAEHTRLIGPLTRFVLNEALAQVRTWLDAGYRIPVAVNLSARNLVDPELPGTVATLLGQYRLSPDLLQLEITESAIMTEPRRARLLLEQLHAMGITIAIDDFGAGYTSLAQLKDLPVSSLKVDRSFVMTMREDAADAQIVRSVVDLGHNLRLQVVAEGVEDEQALDTLSAFGCDIAQGYHVARPMPAEDYLAWHTAHQQRIDARASA